MPKAQSSSTARFLSALSGPYEEALAERFADTGVWGEHIKSMVPECMEEVLQEPMARYFAIGAMSWLIELAGRRAQEKADKLSEDLGFPNDSEESE